MVKWTPVLKYSEVEVIVNLLRPDFVPVPAGELLKQASFALRNIVSIPRHPNIFVVPFQEAIYVTSFIPDSVRLATGKSALWTKRLILFRPKMISATGEAILWEWINVFGKNSFRAWIKEVSVEVQDVPV